MYLGPPCYGYALHCHLVCLAIPGTRPLCMQKQNMFVLFICNRKSEIQICLNKHETGLELEDLNIFDGSNLTHISNADQESQISGLHTQLTEASTSSTYNWRYKNERKQRQGSSSKQML